MCLWKRSDAGEAAIALLSPTSMLEEGSMRYTTLLATAASHWRWFILAYCASVPGPLTYDAKSSASPIAALLWNCGSRPGQARSGRLVMHGCSGINDNHRGWAGRLREWGYAAAILDSFDPRNTNSTYYQKRKTARSAGSGAFNAAIIYGRCRSFSPTVSDHRLLFWRRHGAVRDPASECRPIAAGVPSKQWSLLAVPSRVSAS